MILFFRKFIAICVMVSFISMTTGCATGSLFVVDAYTGEERLSNQTKDTGWGALGGALGGAVLGAIGGAAGGNAGQGAVIGAVTGLIIGGSAGSYIGYNKDKLEMELGQRLRKHGIKVSIVAVDGVEYVHLVMPNNITFVTGSYTVKQSFLPVLDSIRLVLERYNVALQVVGHTDSVGSAQRNQELSENRALAVAQAMTQTGIMAQIYTKGMGESSPVESNKTSMGRALNRRVEIYFLPVEEPQSMISPDFFLLPLQSEPVFVTDMYL